MLNTNLSTRPFYNERAVYLVLALAALAVLAVTVLNVQRLVALSARNTQLAGQVADNQAAAAELNLRAEAIDRSTNRRELEAVTAAAREANDLIERRTFSWTEFFNLIETTLPPDVRLTAVRPQVREGVVTVAITVVSRSTGNLDTFMAQLEKTGAFADLLVRQEEVTDEGLHRAILNGRYLARAAAQKVPPKTSPSEARSGT
jgi:Tfp pilus assembly protein PilN